MSVICSICHDNLTERPQTLPAEHELVAVTLHCGHLFHSVCIHQWFRNGGVNANNRSLVDCPCCKKGSNLNSARRIYPTCEHDTKESLEKEAENKTKIIIELTANLEKEKDAHELLKLEHGTLQSEVHELREELKENKNIYEGLETSLKYKIENLEIEKMKAQERMFELQAREQNLQSQLIRLKQLNQEKKGVFLAHSAAEEESINHLLLTFPNYGVGGGEQNFLEDQTIDDGENYW